MRNSDMWTIGGTSIIKVLDAHGNAISAFNIDKFVSVEEVKPDSYNKGPRVKVYLDGAPSVLLEVTVQEFLDLLKER